MCNLNEFDSSTEAQRLRDDAFLDETWQRFVAPLATELEEAVPGYRRMGWYERFVALMRLNEKHAPNGASLMLDFGTVAAGLEEDMHVAYANMPARGAVFAGHSNSYVVEERDGTRIYTPRFADSNPFGASRCGLPIGEEQLLDYSLPLPFRVALLARYVRQNVFVSPVIACRFASGSRSSDMSRRWYLDSIETEHGQLFGWQVLIRDTTPTNNLALNIVGKIRRHVEERESAFSLHGTGKSVAEVGPGTKRRRTRRESTDSLIWFVEQYLPSKGKTVFRSGDGEKISWKRAHELFDGMFPDTYKNHTTFRNAYYNARKARKEEER